MTSIRQVTTGVLAAVSLTALSMAAVAQDWTMGPAQNRGLYLEGAGGATWTESFDVQSGPVPPGAAGAVFGGAPFSVESDFSTGWAAGGRVGYGFSNGLRLEGEVMYRYNDLDGASVSRPLPPGSSVVSRTGSVETVSLMANALYDISTNTRFTPYVGVGGGAAWVNEDVRVSAVNGGVGQTIRSNEDTWVPAVQAIGGVNVAVTPAVSVSLDYRYLHGFDVSTTNTFGNSTSDDYSNHSVFVGVRYTFGAPAAPAPMAAEPAMPAAAAQLYLVFFDFDRYSLTPDGRAVVDQVAARAMQGGPVQQLQVSGYTDRSGAPQYNLRLSQRRAETVRTALIQKGVPANEIVTRWFGEENPRVPTPDGVREPQNRRVEILVQ